MGSRRRVFDFGLLIFLMFYYRRSVVWCQLLGVDFIVGCVYQYEYLVVGFGCRVVASANCRLPGVAFRCLLLVPGY